MPMPFPAHRLLPVIRAAFILTVPFGLTAQVGAPVAPVQADPGGSCQSSDFMQQNVRTGQYWVCGTTAVWTKIAPANVITTRTTDPTGAACDPKSIALRTPGGALYTCENGVYTATGSGTPAGIAGGALAGSTYPNPLLAAFKDAKADCGVKGDKTTDDTAAIQACIDGTADYHTIFFPAGLSMKITSALNMNGRYGLTLAGISTSFGGPSAGKDAPTFYWYGADGGIMLNMHRCNTCAIRNLTFFSASNYLSPSTAGADEAIDVDNTGAGGTISTNDLFDQIAVVGSTQRDTFRGLAFALNSGSNVEHMTVRDSYFSCSYTGDYTTSVGQGIVIGPSFNAKKHYYTNNSITNCATGIYLASGSADIVHNQFNQNGTHIYATPADTMKIDDNDSENAVQFFRGGFAYGSSISNNRIAAVHPPAGVGAIQFTSGTTPARVEGNGFDVGAYTPVSGTGGPYGNPALISAGNQYPDTTNTLAGLLTFGYGASSMRDNIGNAMAAWMMKGTPTLGTPVASFGFLDYDYSSQKWVISENGNPYHPLLPGASTVANLPTCNAAAEGLRGGATNLLTPTYLGTATGGGAVHGPVYCNGTAWITN